MHQDCCSLSSCLSECFYLWPAATGVLGGQMWKMEKHKKHERRSAGSLKYSGRDTDNKLPTCAAYFCLLINNSSACLWLYNKAISSLKDHCAFSPTSLLFARLAYLRWHPTGSLVKYWKSFTPCLDFSFFFFFFWCGAVIYRKAVIHICPVLIKTLRFLTVSSWLHFACVWCTQITQMFLLE